MTRIVLVPGTLALLPEYASLEDPVPDLRFASRDAVSWLADEVRVLADDQGRRVAEALLAERPEPPTRPRTHEESWLVVGNGSAKRTEKAPGHLDERAEPFDERLGRALGAADPEALRGIDQALAADLWAATGQMPALADLLSGAGAHTVAVDYEGAPYGVQYWVMRWRVPSP